MSRIIILDSGAEKRLPAEYVEVEYLQSSGTQYIDTGAINSNFDTYEINLKYSINTLSASCVYGAGYNGYRQANYFFNVSGTTSLYFGGSSIIPIRTASINTIYEDNILCNKLTQKAIINGGTPVTANIGTTTYPFYLFNFNSDGAAGTQPLYGKVYNWSLKQNNTLVRNFIPCYRKSDNVAGMYDLVNDVFYENAGTGNFTLGPDVTATYYETIERSVIYQPGLLDRTVRFKVDNQDYQVVSVKAGNAVLPPYNKPNWEDSEGNTITFPYTPTADINLYEKEE